MTDNYNESENYNGYGYVNTDSQTLDNSYNSINAISGMAKIKVIGVGGAGNNAVDRLIESGLDSAEFIVVNTDSQALLRSKATNRIQIGKKLTKGLGAGADPTIGKAAAEENKEVIQQALKDTDLLFITAGMGGGTGTGAAPVIAKIAKELKILTVAVVTLPFTFEAKRRMDNAMAGIEELTKSVDSMITIPNDKIREVVPKGTSFADSLKVADEVLRQGIRGIAELIVKPSLINLDFADVKTTLKDRGVAHMGIGVAKGENRITDAVRCAVCSPLLNTTIEGASSVILNIIGGKDLTLDEVGMAADLVKGVIDYSANVIFGACIDEGMSDEVEVVIIATGFNGQSNGFTTSMPDNALRQATLLSQKIDQNSFRPQPSVEPTYVKINVAQPSVEPTYAKMNVAQPSVEPTYANFNSMQSNVEPMYGQPYPSQQPIEIPVQPVQANFEPEDPIPTPSKEEPEKRRRPRWVDHFMKRKSDD